MDLLFIGRDEKAIVNFEKTKEQIDKVKRLECLLVYKGKRLNWKDLDNEKDKTTLFQKILHARLSHSLSNTGDFCVLSVIENKVLRLEYYEYKYPYFELVQDYRAREIQNKKLLQFLKNTVINDLSTYLESIQNMKDLIEYDVHKEMIQCSEKLTKIFEDDSVKQFLKDNFDILTIETVENQEFRYIYVNYTFLRLATMYYIGDALNSDYVISKIAHELFPLETADRVVIDNREVIRTGKVLKKEMMLEFRRAGDVYLKRWYASRRSAIFNKVGEIYAIIFSGRDITEKKMREEKEYQERLKKMPPTLDSVYLIDTEGKVLACNEEGARRFDMRVEELIGKNLNAYLQDINTTRSMIDLEIYNKDRIRRFESERNGRHFDNTIYPILNEKGIVFQFAIFSHDISERVRMRREEEE